MFNHYLRVDVHYPTCLSHQAALKPVPTPLPAACTCYFPPLFAMGRHSPSQPCCARNVGGRHDNSEQKAETRLFCCSWSLETKLSQIPVIPWVWYRYPQTKQHLWVCLGGRPDQTMFDGLTPILGILLTFLPFVSLLVESEDVSAHMKLRSHDLVCTIGSLSSGQDELHLTHERLLDAHARQRFRV